MENLEADWIIGLKYSHYYFWCYGRECCDHQQKFTSTSKINIVLEILLMDHITLLSFVVQCSFAFSSCLNDELRAHCSVILVTLKIL